jgi:hypothetical protein
MTRPTDVVRFRYSGAIVVSVIVALFGALPLALGGWYSTPVLIPLGILAWGTIAVLAALGLWAARAGVDGTPDGLVIRSAIGSRWLLWTDISGFTTAGSKVTVLLRNGAAVSLPAVRPTDVPRLIIAGGQELDSFEESTATLRASR